MNNNFETEYKAVRESGAGFFEFTNRGLIEVSGSEAVQFLNGLITNDVKTLKNDSWMWAAFPNAQGRLLALVRVLRRDDKFLFDVDAVNYQTILQNLMRFTFAGDFNVNDLSSEFTLISLQASSDFQIRDLKIQLGNPNKNIIVDKFENRTILMLHAAHFSPNGLDFIVPKTVAPLFAEFFEMFGTVKISDETAEVLRVEMGMPRYGVDMDETTVVLETGIDEAVSFTKGCYIGQEIIARIHFRGHVAKKLTGLILAENAVAQPNDGLKSAEGKNAGRITSSVFSPKLKRQIALGYVRHEFLAAGTILTVNDSPAIVTDLPFIGEAS